MTDQPVDDLDFGRASTAQHLHESRGAAFAPPPRRGPTVATVAGERVISPVAGRFGAGRGAKAVTLLGLLAGCGVFLAATWTHPRVHKATPAADEPVRQVVDFASVRAPEPAERAAAAAPVPSASAPLSPAGVAASSLTSQGEVVPAIALGGAATPAGSGPTATSGGPATDAKASAAREAAAQEAARLQAVHSAPILAFSADRTGSPERPLDLSPSSGAGAAGQPAGSGAGELDQLRRGSSIGLVRATRLPDRDFLLSAGAVVPCVLETALDTSAPGFVTCRVPKDIYSDSGGVVLLEKGSRVLGEYRSGFQEGRARIFVLWDRITTPGGVAVDVSSPASDALGRAGFGGRVDSHFWERFGGALLLTTVQGALSAAAASDTRFATVAQAPNEAAAGALQNSISIPPTLTKLQGSEVAIFVSRDLDFSGVYALKAR